MKFGKLDFVDVSSELGLVSPKANDAIEKYELQGVLVAQINPNWSDTGTFCEQYDVDLDVSANCVVVEAKRGDNVWYAACVVLGNTRADINGAVRRHLGARKISFAPLDKVTAVTGMKFGGITPIGLPEEWEILIDSAVVQKERVIVGSGVRKSKLLIPGKLLTDLPRATVLDMARTD